jgi:hypothetical protein
MLTGRSDHFRFGFYKKSNKTDFLKKPKPNRNRFKPVWLDFSSLARFFPVFLVYVRFGSVFRFQAYKTETKPVGFFKILIGLINFCYSSVFSVFIY